MKLGLHDPRGGFCRGKLQTIAGVDRGTQWRTEWQDLGAKLRHSAELKLASKNGIRHKDVSTTSCQPKHVSLVRPLRTKKNDQGFRSYKPPDEFSRGASDGAIPSIDDEELPTLGEYPRSKEPPSSAEQEELRGWEYRRDTSGVASNFSALTQGEYRYVLGGLFVLGMRAGIAVDTVLNVEPNNITSQEMIDRQTPNPDVCIANRMSAMVLDQRHFIPFNPFSVYVSQAEVKPGCLLRQSNWRGVGSGGLVKSEEVRDCKPNFNRLGFVGDLRQAPEISRVYHSEATKNQFLEAPSKAAVTCYAKEVRCSTEGQGQTQTIKNETILTNKAPLQSKEKSPKLDDGGTGLPPRGGDGGGGGGGGGGGWGGGGFVFWALLLLIGFLRDRELDKPYSGPKRKKKQKRGQFT